VCVCVYTVLYCVYDLSSFFEKRFIFVFRFCLMISFPSVFVFVFVFLFSLSDWQRDSSVRDVDYESFDSILCSNRSQKSQEISIRRSSNDVRTLRDQESRHAEFSLTRQHSF